MIECEYLSWGSGFLGTYKCLKNDGKPVDTYTRHAYCQNGTKYRDCVIFRKNESHGGCYLTTAMCEVLGMDDHCYVLDTLRGFRDNYMINEPECIPLLNDYNTIGPIIADKIYDDEEASLVAGFMYSNYIVPATLYIEKEDNETAIDIYKTMTLDLMDRYGIDYDFGNYGLSPENNKPKQRKREI